MRALRGPFHPEKAGANAKFGPVDDSDCRELDDLRWSDPLESPISLNGSAFSGGTKSSFLPPILNL